MPMTQNYDTGVDISNQREATQQEMGQQNPILDALKTLQLYVASQREQGNEAPMAAFMQFLEALRGGGGQTAPEQQRSGYNPFEAPPEPPPAQVRQSTPGPDVQGKAKVMGM